MRGNANTGQTTYAQSCLACHGPRLEGSPFAPALVGSSFQDHWRGKPAAELLAQMRKTMPPKGTGTVRPEAFPDLLAFLVKANEEGSGFLAKLIGASGLVGHSHGGEHGDGDRPNGSHARSGGPAPEGTLPPSRMPCWPRRPRATG
ncbi:MAG: cytochrome c [Proteobacteria bacterium]|nr:cytochrome c [Pseudomonadota bacterium]